MGFSLNCLLLSFLYLLIVKNNQASACTERLANASPMGFTGKSGKDRNFDFVTENQGPGPVQRCAVCDVVYPTHGPNGQTDHIVTRYR